MHQQRKQTSKPSKPVYTYLAYFDGAYEPINPGTAAYGAVLLHNGKVLWESSELVDSLAGKQQEMSNNVAEYCGLIAVLEYLISIGAQNEPIIVRGDSTLVIQQMWGTWKIKQGTYLPYALKAKELCRTFTNLHGEWVPRALNTTADALSKAPLQAAGIA